MRLADIARVVHLRRWCLPDFNCTGELSRPVAVSDVLGVLHVSFRVVRDDRWKRKLREWSGLYHMVEFQFLQQRHLRRRTATADIPRVCELSCGQLSDVAWIAELSGRLQLSAASTDYPRGQLRDSVCPGDDAGKSDMPGCCLMRAKPDVPSVRHLRGRADLCACRHVRRDHMPELQHLRRIRIVRWFGDLQQRSYVRG